MSSSSLWTWKAKGVLITGGSQGLGALLGEEVSVRGATVMLVDIDERGLKSTAARIAKKSGKQVHFRVANVRNSDSVEAAVRDLSTQYGGIDVMVNNAGIAEPSYLFPDVSDEHVDRLVDIDLNSVIKGTAIATRFFDAQGRGGVVLNTASMAGLVPTPMAPTYAAAKAGVVAFTRSLAYLAEQRGVRVVAVCPTFTDTAMVQANGEEAVDVLKQMIGGRLLEPIEVVQAMIALIERGQPGDIARVTVQGGVDFFPPNAKNRARAKL
jgi:15-hydroxyprostaglandin dehydrogenase (NAD)